MAIDLNELERLGQLAAPAPWESKRDVIESVDDGPNSIIIYDEGGHDEDDARFIVAARNNWQAMIDEIRRLREERLELMAIRWPVEEWIDGRIDAEDLRETVTPLVQ